MLRGYENNQSKVSEEEYTWLKRLARGLYYYKSKKKDGNLEKGTAEVDSMSDSFQQS